MGSQPRKKVHPAVLHAQDQLARNQIDRREFLKLATLLGVSVPTAYALAACAPSPTAPAATAAPVATTGPAVVPTAASAIKRGGTVKWAAGIQPVDHPAKISWGFTAHIIGHVAEYLTYIDPKGLVYPRLLEKWEASDDVKTWTLYLRKGIKFHHGKDFNADDVIFNLKQWLDPTVGSSILGLMSGYLAPNDIERVDDYTVRLHASRPEIAVPYHLRHYPALIMPSDFEGDWSKQPYGTGAFDLKEWVNRERVVMTARKDYWRKAANGDQLPYVAEAQVFDLGDEVSAVIAAMQSGQIDTMGEPQVEIWKALKDDARINVQAMTTAQTAVMRTRSDVEPWNKPEVRKALLLCQKRQDVLDTACFGQGSVGSDTHTNEIHPEYFPVQTPPYDTDGAKALLAKAGYANGVDVKITVGASFPWCVAMAETIKASAAPAGFRIEIEQLPGSEYWNVWTEAALAVTEWGHRPLGTMVFNLAYTSEAGGKPVAWNESHWVDAEFDKVLAQANGTLDIEARRKLMGQLEQIQIDRGSAGIPAFRNVWRITSKRVMNMPVHSMMVDDITEVWLSDAPG